MSIISAAKQATSLAKQASGFLSTQSPFTTFRTRCVVRFFPFKKRDTLNGDNTNDAMDAIELVEDSAITACTISRDKGTPTDVFQITLKPTKNWKNVLKAGDWLIIYLDDIENISLKDLKGVKCIGNIDRIAETTIIKNDGSREVVYNVHGSGWGKFFEQTEMFYNPYAGDVYKNILIDKIGYDFQGSPYDFVTKYLDVYFGDAKKQGLDNTLYLTLIPPKLYNALTVDSDNKERSKGSAVSFNDVMVRDFKDNTKEGFSNFRSISRIMSGSLWNTLMQSCNRVLNEMFVDIRNGKPTLIYRKMPLTKDLRQEIQDQGITDIPQKYILNAELGFSDHELFNYLTLIATDSLINDITYIVAATNAGVNLPRVAKDSTKRYGLRRIELNTEYAIDKQNGEIVWDAIKKWVDELEDHWFNYYHFENGTIELKGLMDFKIGQYIRLPEQQKIYMVNSITWSWEFGQTPVVSLTVLYGQKENGDYIDVSENSDKIMFGTTDYNRISDKTFKSGPLINKLF